MRFEITPAYFKTTAGFVRAVVNLTVARCKKFRFYEQFALNSFTLMKIARNETSDLYLYLFLLLLVLFPPCSEIITQHVT